MPKFGKIIGSVGEKINSLNFEERENKNHLKVKTNQKLNKRRNITKHRETQKTITENPQMFTINSYNRIAKVMLRHIKRFNLRMLSVLIGGLISQTQKGEN